MIADPPSWSGAVHDTVAWPSPPDASARIFGGEGNDIAIYKLDRAVTNVTPSPISRTTPTVGQLLTLVGFGGGGTGTTGHTGDYGTKRVGTTPIDQVTAQTIFWNFDNNTESNTAPGDSGGPAFVVNGGLWELAGINSFTTGTAGLTTFGNYSGYNDIARFQMTGDVIVTKTNEQGR